MPCGRYQACQLIQEVVQEKVLQRFLSTTYTYRVKTSEASHGAGQRLRAGKNRLFVTVGFSALSKTNYSNGLGTDTTSQHCRRSFLEEVGFEMNFG